MKMMKQAVYGLVCLGAGVVVSTAVLVTVGKPAAVLVFVGTLNGLILPIALALILLAAYRSNIVGIFQPEASYICLC